MDVYQNVRDQTYDVRFTDLQALQQMIAYRVEGLKEHWNLRIQLLSQNVQSGCVKGASTKWL
jgi:hypothetical protein